MSARPTAAPGRAAKPAARGAEGRGLPASSTIPTLRRLLKDVKRQTEIRIDTISTDAVSPPATTQPAPRTPSSASAIPRRAPRHTRRPADPLRTPHAARRLDRAAIEELRDAMRRPPWLLEPIDIWRAYKRLDDDRVKGNPARALSDIVMLVRYALGARRRWSRCPRRSPAASTCGSAARSAPAAPTPRRNAPGFSRSATSSRSMSTSPPRI